MVFNNFFTLSDIAQQVLFIPINFLPKLIGAVIVFSIGLFVAYLVRKAFETIFKVAGFFDESLKSVGLQNVLQHFGLTVNLGYFFGRIFSIFIIVLFLIASLDIIGFSKLNDYLIAGVLQELIPRVVIASIVLIIGLIVANFVSELVYKTSKAARLDGAFIATISKTSIIIFSVLAALVELGVANEIINILVIGLIASVSLAAGLAFGIGGQDVAKRCLEKIENNLKK